jgi:prephenate dehydrogenase
MRIVSIVGVGLIGGSFGLALRKAGFDGAIYGVSSESSIEAARQLGAIDRGVTLREAAAESDLIYLSGSIEAILETIPRLGEALNKKCLVTDAGSTKLAITTAAQRSLPADAFVGGHPMAGKEQRGVQAADADLFRDRPYILTPTEPALRPVVAEFRRLLTAIGANLVEMPPEEHDAVVAFTSHLPQLLSTALAATLAGQDTDYIDKMFGPGLIDMTRLSLSAPEIWMSVIATNKEFIDKALGAFQDTLNRVRKQLGNSELIEVFRRGQDFADGIRQGRPK